MYSSFLYICSITPLMLTEALHILVLGFCILELECHAFSIIIFVFVVF